MKAPILSLGMSNSPRPDLGLTGVDQQRRPEARSSLVLQPALKASFGFARLRSGESFSFQGPESCANDLMKLAAGAICQGKKALLKSTMLMCQHANFIIRSTVVLC